MSEKAMSAAFSGTSAHTCAEEGSACSYCRAIVSVLGISLLMSIFVIRAFLPVIRLGIIVFLISLAILINMIAVGLIQYRQEQNACIC